MSSDNTIPTKFLTEVVIPDCPIDELKALMNYLSERCIIFSVQARDSSHTMICPVCGETPDPNLAPHIEYKGEKYSVCGKHVHSLYPLTYDDQLLLWAETNNIPLPGMNDEVN